MLSSADSNVTGLRLDWNESPLGPSPRAVARLAENAAHLYRYPRGLLADVTAAVAEYHGVAPDRVLLTNGVDEAIDLALSLVESAWYVEPGFDGYADRTRAGGKPGRPIPLDLDWQPTVPARRLAHGGAVFLAQPHSPTGGLFRPSWVREVVDTAELTFFDLTYVDFATVATLATPAERNPRLLLFHSFSKSFGLAGVRLGALVGDTEVIAMLAGRQRFHSVNSVALHAVAGALGDIDHKDRLCRHVKEHRPRYVAELRRSIVLDEVRDTHGNFVVARCRSHLTAGDVTAALASRGVWVRDCSSFGLDGWLRISVGTADDLSRLTAALTDVARSFQAGSGRPGLSTGGTNQQATQTRIRGRMPMAPADFEHRLVEALQPIRQLALAQALYALLDSGGYDTLDAEPGLTAAVLADRHGLDADRLVALCHYLANEGYLVEDRGWYLTEKARALAPFRPWYTLLVGGYSQAFHQLGSTLRAGAHWASRDAAKVGAGSCGMSRYDALPLAIRLLEHVPTADLTVVDLGCGDAGFLCALATQRPGLRGIGFEPDPGGARLAAGRVRREGLADRITIQQGPAADVIATELPDGPVCFLAAFVLQEMLEQDGEAAVEELLRKTTENYPAAHWLVVEVDHRVTDRTVMAHSLSQAYYNPYFLLHAITEQRLERREFWDALFVRAGLVTAAIDYPDRNVDSTGLELGYLLRRASGAP